jgi:DNA-binding transcriptional LysR family regulator
MDLDLRRLRYFVTVAGELSFIRAAQLLHMTQPALSRQISALERDLGAQLFERDRRGTALTPAGQQLLEDAAPLLAAASALERRTRLAGREPARFAIGFMPGTNATPIIREFAQRAPYLTIDVVEERLERVALGAGVLVLPAGIADFYRRTDISYVPLQDVAARMVALAYHKHRTMPELVQFASLVASTLGMELEPAPEPAG